MELDDCKARYLGGLATTASLLLAGHYFSWWRPLPRLAAYVFGATSILLGQGIYLRFDRRWRALAGIAAAGGGVVGGAYLYDWSARKWVNWIANRGKHGLSTVRGQ